MLDFGGVLAGPGADGRLLAGVAAAARRDGVRTAILSNDPGGPGAQALRDLEGVFVDVVVVSGDIGMAKPDRRIYEYTAKLLGLPPGDCIFVDDMVGNVRGAVAAGMVGVHHTDPATAAEEIVILLGRDGWESGSAIAEDRGR